MRKVFFLVAIFLISCSPRIQEMRRLLEQPENIIVPYDSTFLEFANVIDYFGVLDQQQSDTNTRIVFTGSSSIRMWETLATDMDTFNRCIINRGFGGSILPEVNYYFDQLILPHNPDLIVLYCGENDIIDGYSPQEVYQAFRTFLRLYLHKAPDAKLLFIGLKPSPARWSRWDDFAETNKLIERLIKRLDSPKISYLDVAPIMLTIDNNGQQRPLPSIFLQDSLHMNAAGYALWTTAVESHLQALYNYN